MSRRSCLVVAALLALALMRPTLADEAPADRSEPPADDHEGSEHDQADVSDEEGPGVPSDPLYLFHRMDENRDGVLDKNEFRDAEFLHHFGHVHGGEKADVAKIIAAMDKNKDAKVDAEEFLAYVSPLTELAYAKSDFEAADEDGDKHLNFTEWQFSAHAMDDGVPAPGDKPHEDPEYVKTLTSAFNALDTDKDKKISLEEYLAVQGKDHFTQIDVDGDGKISKEEFKDYNTRYGATPTHIEDMFVEYDKNNDGQLSRVEHRGEYSNDDYHEEHGDDDVQASFETDTL